MLLPQNKWWECPRLKSQFVYSEVTCSVNYVICQTVLGWHGGRTASSKKGLGSNLGKTIYVEFACSSLCLCGTLVQSKTCQFWSDKLPQCMNAKVNGVCLSLVISLISDTLSKVHFLPMSPGNKNSQTELVKEWMDGRNPFQLWNRESPKLHFVPSNIVTEMSYSTILSYMCYKKHDLSESR